MRDRVDEDGVPLPRQDVLKERGRFLHARDGDHLMTTFMCELCHFRNVNRRDPIPGNKRHDFCLQSIRRVNIDAFWSTEPTTVASNLREIKRLEKTGDNMDIDEMTPPLGPFPLEDLVGMKIALGILDRSQDETGMYEKYVQPATYRRPQSALTNLHQVTLEGVKEQLGLLGLKKIHMSTSSTHTRFFNKFMRGINIRTGSVVRQDKEISIEVLLGLLEMLEDKWSTASTPGAKLRISKQAAWFVIGFCTGIRGEEGVLTELAATLRSLSTLTEFKETVGPHFRIVLNGRTKRNRASGAKVFLPCAGVTKTGINAGRWVERYISELTASGRQTGFLFGETDVHVPVLSDLAEDFFAPLEILQGRPNSPTPAHVDVREDYGIYRSLRRGVTAHATNVNVKEDLINLMNRWSNELKRMGQGGNMFSVYTSMESLLPTTIKYSRSL